MSIAEEIETKSTELPVVYNVADSAIAELREQFSGLTAETPDGYEGCRKGIAVCRKLRGDLESTRVKLKADALAYGRKVDGEAKRLTALLLEIEEPLKASKAIVDEAAERKKREKEDAERAAIQAELQRQRDEAEAKAKAEREAEAAELARERAKIAAERKAFEEARAAEAAERAKVEAEQKAERAKIEAEQKAERDKLEAERRAIEAERQAAINAKLEAEREKIAAERAAVEKARQEQEARDQAERNRLAAEKAKKDAEAAEEAERKRVAELRPDLDKIRGLANSLRVLELPTVKTKAAKAFLQGIAADVEALAARCESFGVKQ